MTDKIMEARRAKFEAYWASTRGNIPERNGDGYATPVADCCWESFSTALDSLCVELPSKWDHVLDGRGRGMYAEDIARDQAIDDCREAIIAAGVMCK